MCTVSFLISASCYPWLFLMWILQKNHIVYQSEESQQWSVHEMVDYYV